MNALDVEIDSGTYRGHVRQHNGYYAGDFWAAYSSVNHLQEGVETDSDTRRDHRVAIDGDRRLPVAA
jgi:hypothetical protein